MNKKPKRKLYWRKLDDQAKVFALASNNKYSSIFRLSVVLKEEINEKILGEALKLTLQKYKVFKVKMRKGFFWYYFEENDKNPIITVENDYPFKKINTKENNDYLFKVTYFMNKINIDFFHALTDGTGGLEFLNDLIYRYLELKYPNELKEDRIKEDIILKESENAYRKNYKFINEKKIKIGKAYLLKGESLQNGEFAINHFNINLNELKQISKENGCTISAYLVAVIAYSIYETNYKVNDGKRPINISVPISLRKYFSSETISNFFSYMIINLSVKSNKTYMFVDILNLVKKEFEKKMKVEKMVQTITKDAGSTNKVFIRVVPLLLKRIAVRIGSLELKKHFTSTFSNMGKVVVEEKYSKYIENFLVILAPDWAERVKCGVCSYGENLVLTFSTNLNGSSLECKVRDLLKENNISFKIEGNGVNVISN